MNPTLLLDTCAAIWIMGNAWMRDAAVAAMDSASDLGDPVYVSPIIGWEVSLLASRGRFKSHLTPRLWLRQLLATPNIRLAELPPTLLLESSFLPGSPPRDPADRIIAATAREYGFTVMTRDRGLLAYANEGHMSAVEC